MKNRGYISIFLVLILIPMIIGLSLIVSISKYYQFEANLNGEAKLIANSILSKYDKELFDNYGILATEESLAAGEETSLIEEINQLLFNVNKFDITYSKSLSSVNNLKSSIISYQINRFIYNSSKELISAIINREKNGTKEDVLTGFNAIAKLYEEVLDDYESLNDLLIVYRKEYKNLYKKLATVINKEETYIVNTINEIRSLYEKDTGLEIDSKVESTISSAKYISREVDNICSKYEDYSDILSSILLKINTIESKVSEINDLSKQFYELQSNSENKNLKRMLNDSKIFNSFLNDNELKTKVKINLEKSKDIIKELKELSLFIKVNSLIKKIDYDQLKRINLEWVNEFSSELKIVSYIGLSNTEFNSLNIYQDKIEEVLVNDTEFKNLINNLKSIFSNNDVDIENKLINESNAENLYSNNDKTILDNDNLINKAFSKIIIVDYINEIFNCYTSEKTNKSFFVKGEMEYLLNGKHSNEDNIRSTKRKLIALRSAFNLEYILTNPEMMNFISELALVFSSINPMLTPIIKIVLISTIAVTEANIDYHKMIKKEKVPFLKDRESWNLGVSSLKKILEGELNFKKAEVNKGLQYEHYLSILIFISNEENIIKRIGDLIQLNNIAKKEDLLDFSKFYKCINIKIEGKYSMLNKFNPFKIKVVEEGDYQY